MRAREAEGRLKAEQAQHWRMRTFRAKRRLYLYLRTYMAWMSVLKRKRKGCVAMACVGCLLPTQVSFQSKASTWG